MIDKFSKVVYILREEEAKKDAAALVRQRLVQQISIGGCPRDYGQSCPAGWIVNGNDCAPPAGILKRLFSCDLRANSIHRLSLFSTDHTFVNEVKLSRPATRDPVGP